MSMEAGGFAMPYGEQRRRTISIDTLRRRLAKTVLPQIEVLADESITPEQVQALVMGVAVGLDADPEWSQGDDNIVKASVELRMGELASFTEQGIIVPPTERNLIAAIDSTLKEIAPQLGIELLDSRVESSAY